MYNGKGITSKEEKDEFLQVWKYLSANGKLFIPVESSEDSSAVYAEEDDDGNKTIRAFMDSQAIALYISEIGEVYYTGQPLKVGITPVKILQKKLTEVYGKEVEDDKTVQCLLTTYDDSGNMMNVDVIWTQSGN